MYRKGRALRRRTFLSDQSVFRRELRIGATWWGVGLLIGLVFVTTLGSDLRQTLGQYLQSGVAGMTGVKVNYLDFFLKRSWTYGKIFLLVWLLTYWKYGSWGIRIILCFRGFLHGYAQGAWIFAYGLRGILLGLAVHGLPSLMLLVWITGVGCAASRLRTVERKTRLVIEGGLTVLLAMSVAAVEAYVTPGLLAAFQ